MKDRIEEMRKKLGITEMIDSEEELASLGEPDEVIIIDEEEGEASETKQDEGDAEGTVS
ncbi:hypothetical protein [Amedibacterium intestinale]|uniref:Uncharacterized protein n=1 Tax=Amedibacterium intestinale TaxID=2583452 RepID=A0A6N4TG87_9FIRM|nr:hypothetical protein [Amedibacterium intestinale]BBK21455.1 hypothetical protein Aargi30884_03580 [Amedibacterium intestinale]